MIKDIFRAEITIGVFLASLTINFLRYPYLEKMSAHVAKLSRNDCLRAKALIDGLALACSEGVDLSLLNYKEVLELVGKLGRDRSLEAL